MIPSVLPTYNRAPLSFVKGEGAWLFEADGRRFLDLGAGIAVNALGHANPDLVKTLTEQAERLWHVSNIYKIPEQEKLANLLIDKTFADTVFFTNSGTETAELAIKMARKYHYDKGHPDRTDIVAFEGAFHGRSIATLSATANPKIHAGFGPLVPGFVRVPHDDLAAIERVAQQDKQVVAVLVEPIQGEGGINVARVQYLQGLRQLCDRMGWLLGAVTQAKLDAQRGVVQNEKREGDNAPFGLTGYATLKALFPEGHPYHHDTIGSMADLNGASLADVQSWFRANYGPNNAVLVKKAS